MVNRFYWTSTLHTIIRKDIIQFLNETYKFFKVGPKEIPMYSQKGQVGTWPFTKYFRTLIEGKAYKESDASKEIILASEKNTEQGRAGSAEVRSEIKDAIQSGSLDSPIELDI